MSSTSSHRRPNLLFVFSDEQRADTLAAYGNERIQMPHIDGFAQTASTLFSSARFHDLIKLHSGVGNEKIRQKPSRVLQTERFRPTTVGHGDRDPLIFPAFRLAVTTWDITMDLQRMHFSA